jgi:tRNA A37 threonylcarbamoyltransferase TsaD
MYDIDRVFRTNLSYWFGFFEMERYEKNKKFKRGFAESTPRSGVSKDMCDFSFSHFKTFTSPKTRNNQSRSTRYGNARREKRA